MDYQAALDYILTFADYERMSRSGVVWDLRRIELLLRRLGNPETSARSVHITGTKGKGSTSAMIASILTRAGYRTGLYTSPHLLSFTERVQIDGQTIPEQTFARLVKEMKPEVETVNSTGGLGELTTFELLTALAFLYFRESKVDYQVMEVGLGGRLDATNVVSPEVCILTSISYDHTDVLGTTLTQIATEKAGIIKLGRPVVSAPQVPEAMGVIEKVCQEREARLVKVGRDVTFEMVDFGPDWQSLRVKGLLGEYDLRIPLLGRYQLENATVAVAAAEVLNGLGAKVSRQDIVDGLAGVRWPGRLQVLRRKPWLVIDGAHNADSAHKLMLALKEYFSFERLFLIFGASADKDIGGMVAELSTLPGQVIVTRSRNPRSADPVRLAGEFAKLGVNAEITGDVASAVDLALSKASPTDLICVTGSLFVVAEVLERYAPAAHHS